MNESQKTSMTDSEKTAIADSEKTMATGLEAMSTTRNDIPADGSETTSASPDFSTQGETVAALKKKKKQGLTILEICIFAVFGGLMFASKVAMAQLPNIHLIALFIISFTVVYRVKALIPIYVYVLLEGIVYGFTPWWIPYLYIWTVLWGVAMLIPRKWPIWIRAILYCIAGGLHGLLFGTLFAPVQALIFNLNWMGTLAWIASGLYFDMIHGISNVVMCTLCIPLIKLLKLMKSKVH